MEQQIPKAAKSKMKLATRVAIYFSLLVVVTTGIITAVVYSNFHTIFTESGELASIIRVASITKYVSASENQFLILAFGGLLILLPFVFLAGWLAGNSIAQSINKLAETANTYTNSGFSSQTNVNVSNYHEINLLASSFETMANRIKIVVKNLEQRITESNSAVETASHQASRRENQLRLITDVAQVISSARDLDMLLPVVAKTISTRFGFYHTGIYLLDEDKQFAVLRAASSEGGQRMLAAKHRLRVGVEGMIGSVARTGKPRIAMDTKTDLAFQESSYLPETRSEAVLPLTRGQEIIGVLDVESNRPNEFSNEDIQVLASLANQVSVAIENTILLSQTRDALAEAEKITRQYVQQQWSGRFAHPGYVFDGNETYLIGTGEKLSEETQVRPAMVPITLRGQVIGRLEIKPKSGKVITEEELAMAKIAAERSALALENARLIEDSQLRVATERAIGDISAKLNASPDIDIILRTAVQELGQAILDSNISLQLLPGETDLPVTMEAQNG